MKHSKTSLFLMEFIVGILFFSIALALCVQLFVKAKTINEESVQKNKAQLIAGYIIENYKADQSLENSMYFDEQGLVCTKDNYYYLAKIDQQNHLFKISICYQNHGIYTIEYYHYHQRRWEASS